MKWLFPSAIAAAVIALYLYDRNNGPQPDPGQPMTDNQSQETTPIEDVQVAIDAAITPDTPPAPEVDPMANRKAFLDMLAFSEGTSGPNGYNTLFGGGIFDSFADHPRKVFSFSNSKGEQLTTSAAGRYQFLARTWDSLKAKLSLPDFGPDSQDAAALELVRQRGAIPDVDAGRLDAAIQKCSPIWASLPGAGYSQPERKLTDLNRAYAQAGGTIDTQAA